MEIGKDINGKVIKLNQKVTREDGTVGRFKLVNLALIFEYEKASPLGATVSYATSEYTYEIK